MADKNVKAELNAENLEGVAGGANQSIIEQEDGARGPWSDEDLHSSEKRLPEDDGKKSKSNKGKIRFG